eukprot:TRINITY_DN8299_c0_g3_i1.p1 TRINITY_DN8299_c0_g3~~TRINITY_DN8299_c0_g3_i1.p1  ORF type:complete len:303 (+),score=106.70 TRINITY_DN8299_c0_g3_i1:82-909(+)
MAAGTPSAPPAAPPLPPITTLYYQGPAPYPHPAVAEPTPDEQYQGYVRQQEEEQKQRDAELAAQQEQARHADPSSGGGSALGKLSMFAKAAAHSVSKAGSQFHGTVEAKVRQETQEKDKRRWQANFPEQVEAGAHWICDYGCKVMHAGQTVAGNIIVSSTHLCWLSSNLKESIPLTEIATICRSVTLQTVNSGPPYILPVPAMHVIPDCLQVFTTKMQVFQFLEFKSMVAEAAQRTTSSLQGTPLERCYNFLDHAWRAACTVPNPAVEYQPPPQQ